MSFKLYLINRLTPLIPPTQLYPFKSWLFRRAGFDVHPTARIVSSVSICSSQINLAVGKDTFIGHETMISGGPSSISIGDFVDIGPRVLIVSGTHEIDMAGSRSAGKGCSLDIKIEDGVWIGANSTITGGVTIGEKSVIAAGSTVIHSIPPYVVAAGIPCKPIKRWDEEQQEMVRI